MSKLDASTFSQSDLPEPLNEDEDFRQKDYLLTCTDGRKSVLAYACLVDVLGLKNVKIVSGGINAWADSNLPTVCHQRDGFISSDSEDD